MSLFLIVAKVLCEFCDVGLLAPLMHSSYYGSNYIMLPSSWLTVAFEN